MPRRLALYLRKRRYLNLLVAVVAVLGVVAVAILVRQGVYNGLTWAVIALTAAAWLLALVILWHKKADPEPPQWAGDGGLDLPGPDYDAGGADHDGD